LTAVGIFFAARMTSFEGFGTVNNFIVLPLYFASGAQFPLELAPAWLQAIARLNPLAYAVDLLRGLLLGVWTFAPVVDLLALTGFALAALAAGRVREVLPLVEQYEIGDRRVNLLARGRVVNLAAGQGHPSAVMDMSFANLALAVEHLVLHGDSLEHRVLDVPHEIDDEIARLKLESLGVEIDTLTPDQEAYLSSWESG